MAYVRQTRNTRTYRDIDFNFLMHPRTGDVSVKEDIDAVKQSIRNLVLTHFHERPFQKKLGSRVHTLLFENFTPFLGEVISTEVRNVIYNYEPRAIVLGVNVLNDLERQSITIDIRFKMKNTDLPISVDVILEKTR